MLYYVAGSNIFGQWFTEDLVINHFRAIANSKHESGISMAQTKILQINWSYNILRIDGHLYLSGFWDGKEKQLVRIPIPDEYSGPIEDLIVAGNDYKLIFFSKNSNMLFVSNSINKEFKRMHIDIEGPREDSVKKARRDYKLSKVVFLNDSCLYLSSLGHVYYGILPTYLDTMHCRGKIIDIQCGYEHFVLLTDAGVVYTWGNGRRLQLGHGDVSNLELPTEIEALSGIRISKISCGGWHSLALSEFGDVYVWGWNDTGQLGIKHDKEAQSYPVPTLVDLIDNNGEDVTINVKDIACGSRHSAVVLEDNSVWTTGCNKYGQLGLSDDNMSTICYFKRAFQSDHNCRLLCGPWTTVIISS